VRVVGLCDVNPRHLKQALQLVDVARQKDGPAAVPYEAPRGFTNYRALLDQKDLDAVLIATPVHQHASQTLSSLAAGKHVYCEKPMAHDAAECREVLSAASAAERAGQVFQLGFQRRYNARYRRSIQFVHSGEAGRVLFVRAQWHATGNSPKDKPWLFRRDKSGGMVLEQACHQFDVFNWLFQSVPLRVCGFGGVSRPDDQPSLRDTMDHYGAVIEYPSGGRVHFSHLSFAIADRRFSGIYELVFGERKGVDLSNAVVWSDGGGTQQLAAEPSLGGGGTNDTQEALKGFLHSIVTGRRPEANAEVGYRATMAAILCQRALESGRVVEWKEIEPT
jgi:predicted dehydrogenase